jgi:hypothetical protein
MPLSPEMPVATAITLTSAVGIVNTFMEEQEKVTHCEVPGCNKKLFGNTYMCCRPHGDVSDMSHKGHTCCEECATTEAYIEKNRCAVCMAVASGRRSGTKGAGFPLQPPQLNTLATNMLKVLRDTEDSVIKAREEADAERRADGPRRRAIAMEEVSERKRKREEEALQAAEEEAKRAKLAEEEAKKEAGLAKAKAEEEARRAKLAEQKAKDDATAAEAKAKKDAAAAEAKAKKDAAAAEAKAKEREAAAVAAAEAKAKEREEAVLAAAAAQTSRPSKPGVSEEVRKERAQRAQHYRDKKKQEEKELREKAQSADMFQWQIEKAVAMAKDTICLLGGDSDMWESRLIEAFDGYRDEDDDGEDHESSYLMGMQAPP